MALKPVLSTKEEYQKLPEALRGEYTERNGKYVLTLEGDPDGYVPHSQFQTLQTENFGLKTKVAEFRDNNTLLIKKASDLETEMAKYKDIDPAKYAELAAQHEKLVKKGIKDVDSIDEAIKKAIEPLATQLSAEKEARKQEKERANQARFRELIAGEATKKGVRSNSTRFVVRDAHEVFEYDEAADSLKPKAGKRDPNDPLKDLSPSAWLDSLAKSDSYLFEPTSGADAGSGGNNPGSGNGNPNAKKLINPTPAEKGRYVEEIASGKMIVEYTNQQ